MYNKILIINKSSHFGDYLKEKILSLNVEVINTKDSVDGLIKMRNNKPDLIILDYEILLRDKLNFLKEKNQLKSTVNIPIIILYSKKDKLNKDIILELSKYKLYVI